MERFRILLSLTSWIALAALIVLVWCQATGLLSPAFSQIVLRWVAILGGLAVLAMFATLVQRADDREPAVVRIDSHHKPSKRA